MGRVSVSVLTETRVSWAASIAGVWAEFSRVSVSLVTETRVPWAASVDRLWRKLDFPGQLQSVAYGPCFRQRPDGNSGSVGSFSRWPMGGVSRVSVSFPGNSGSMGSFSR